MKSKIIASSILVFLFCSICSCPLTAAEQPPATEEEMMLSQAQELLSKVAPYQALKLYSQLIADSPDSKEIRDGYSHICRIYSQLGLYEQSYTKGLEAVRIISNFQHDAEAQLTDDYIRKATPLCFNKKFDEARKILNEVISKRLNPLQEARVRNRLGCSYYHQKDYPRAIKEYEKVIKIYPDSKQALRAKRWIGNVYFEDEKYKEAIQAYREVISTYLEYKPVASWAGLFLTRVNLQDKSEIDLLLKEYKGSLKNNPKLKDSTLKKAISYLQKEEYSEAEKELAKIIDNFQNYRYQAMWAQYRIALSYRKMEEPDYDHAAVEYTNLLNEFLGSELAPFARFELGECYYFKKDYQEALGIFNEMNKTLSLSELKNKVETNIADIKKIFGDS